MLKCSQGIDTIRQHDREEESHVRNQLPTVDVESMRRLRPESLEAAGRGES